MAKLLNYFLGVFLPSIAQYLLLPMLAFYLTKEEFGVLGSLEVIVYIFSTLSLFALDRAILKYFHDASDQVIRKRMMSTILWLNIICVLSAIAIGFSLGTIFNYQYFQPLILLLIGSSLLNLSLVSARLFQSEGESIKFMLMSLLKSLGLFIAVYLMLRVFENGIMAYSSGIAVAYMSIIPFYFLACRKYLSLQFDKEFALNVLKFCAPFVPTLMSAWLFSMFGRLVIESFNGMKDLGDFTMSFKLASVYILFNSALVTAFSPIFFKLAKERNNQRITLFIKNINVLSTFVAGVFVFMVSDLITILLPEKYSGIELYTVLIVSGLYVSSVMSYSSNLIFMYQTKSKLHMSIYIVCGAVMALFNLILGALYGVAGIVIAMLLGYLFLYKVHTSYSNKLSELKSPGIKWLSIYLLFIVFIGGVGIILSELSDWFILIKVILTISATLIFFKVKHKVFIEDINYFKSYEL